MNGHEIIAFFMPPIQVIEHLEAVYEINRKKGSPVPEACQRWLQNMQTMRSDEASPIDGTTPAQWNEVEKVIREKVTA